MTDKTIPTKGILKRSVNTTVKCSQEDAFALISSSDELHLWLKKCGAVPGAKSVDIIKGPYDFIGAKRKITFESGDTAQEELLSYNSSANYSYTVTKFSNFLEKLSGHGYGQLWFDNELGETRITWTYTFKYKNIFKRAALSLFLTFVYKKFLNNSLKEAKRILEKK